MVFKFMTETLFLALNIADYYKYRFSVSVTWYSPIAEKQEMFSLTLIYNLCAIKIPIIFS